MRNKRIIVILSVLVILIFAIGAYSASQNQDTQPITPNSNETDDGCCSIVCQLDGNNSIISFRRDASYSADVTIEKINWHGKPAIKQYKEEGGYFCQVIVTYDGWVIGFGGSDDGDDNKIIENLTADMVLNNTISNDTLQEIQDIKHKYGKGHVIIKAPNGTYGVAMENTHFMGDLKPGDYISVPNKYSYVRYGDIQLNSTDKIKIMNKLEISDAFGLSRRDITTFYFYNVNNDTFNGNITDIYVSNDDGSTFGMNTGGLADNILILNKTIKAADIPIAPNYTSIGSFNFTPEEVGGTSSSSGGLFNTVMTVIAFILLIVVVLLLIRLINKIRYARRRRR